MESTKRIMPRKEIEGLGSYVLGKTIEDLQKEFGFSKVRKMAENENPFGCSQLAKKAMRDAIEQTNFYPDGLPMKLANKLSANIGVQPSQLIFGNGSDELIRLITRAYISKGDKAVMADVTFPRYKTNLQIEGGTPVIVPLQDGVHQLTPMLEAITDQTKMVFVCNPNNPTGTIVGEGELKSFIEKVPPHVLIILDEAYYEYVTTDDYLESVPLLDQYPNLIILRTFSKLYGLASLRIGYGIMSAEIVNELLKVKDVFNVNRIAQAAALASLEDEQFVEDMKQKNKVGKAYLEHACEELGLNYFPSQSNFMMVHFPCEGDYIYESLLKEGILVRSGSLLGYPNTVRVTIGDQEDNEAFVAGVKRALEYL